MKTHTSKANFNTDLFAYHRRKTLDVKVEQLIIGSSVPVRIQTMVTTLTSDIDATVQQCLQVARAGAELIRITAPSVQDAMHLGEIRKQLLAQSCTIPLVADIHFNPAAAEVAAGLVSKIRINPGNFSDKQARLVEWDENDYAEDLANLRSKFLQLLQVCRTHQTALRIGANHGSLSGRIMSRFGDTPAGMVESAMEYLRICQSEKFDNVVVSMKASNTRVMVHAYRLLAVAMSENDMHYPLHLGVTEAGDGEDGRIKSAVGIGTLLADGLGDTIRVSLTEDPENELPVARALVQLFENNEINDNPITAVDASLYMPYEYKPRVSTEVGRVGGKQSPVVVADLSHFNPIHQKDIEDLGFVLNDGKWQSKDQCPDMIYVGESVYSFPEDGLNLIDRNDDRYLHLDASQLTKELQLWLQSDIGSERVLMVSVKHPNFWVSIRKFFIQMMHAKLTNPVIICSTYQDQEFDSVQLKAACNLGSPLLDGFGDGVMITALAHTPSKLTSLAFGVLQASRVRFTKTDFIACPGCGRTLFGLRDTLADIKKSTQHLKGLKIGVMGCIVNGPGEMADADYGYVGAGPGKITLYKGKEAVKKNIPQAEAISELISLIKEHGDWLEPQSN